MAVIVAQLKLIAKAENITVTDDGLEAIAELSDGGMRDAISLLDQLSVLSETISAEAVSARMGLSSIQQIQQLLEAAAQHNIQETISLLQDSIENGVEPSALCAQMQRYLRVILLQPEDSSGIIKKDFVLRALDLLQTAQAGFKLTTHRSLPLGICLVKLSSPEVMQKVYRYADNEGGR